MSSQILRHFINVEHSREDIVSFACNRYPLFKEQAFLLEEETNENVLSILIKLCSLDAPKGIKLFGTLFNNRTPPSCVLIFTTTTFS